MQVIQGVADTTGKEVTPAEIWEAFRAAYLEAAGPLALVEHQTHYHGGEEEHTTVRAVIRLGDAEDTIFGTGNGPIAAFTAALRHSCGLSLQVVDYHEHALAAGSDASAAAYVEVESGDGRVTWGVGLHHDILAASLRAIVSAANRLQLGAPSSEETAGVGGPGRQANPAGRRASGK
jgi:2-isopropylmalate synthase